VNAATLRRLALAALVVAIVSGIASLWLLMTGRISTPLMAVGSAVCLVLGLVFDRMAAKSDARGPADGPD
jgi:hypothetical protein